MTISRQRPALPAPSHWIGIRKYWRFLRRPLRELLVELSDRHLSTHAYILGSSGSGKTVLQLHIAMGALLRRQSLVVLDARGDMALAIVELAARAGLSPDLVRFIDLRSPSPVGFNPLSGGGLPYYRALGILDALAAESESWGPQLAEFLRYALLLLAECGGSLTQLEDLFYNRAVRLALIARAQSESVRAFWMRFDALHPDRQAALASPVINKCSLILSTVGLRHMFGHPRPIDLATHLATPGSLTLISLAVDQLHSAGWMVGRVLLASICREVFAQVDVPESCRNDILLLVDEFEHFSGPLFETILAEGRRFRLSAVLAHQNLAQLTPKMRALILGNVGVKVVFRSSYSDSDLLNRDIAGVKGTFDIANLRTGEAVLWRRGEPAFEIEVNAPLIDDVGEISPLARAYIAELTKHGEVMPDPVDAEVSEAVPEQSADSPQPGLGKPDLEDWLSQ